MILEGQNKILVINISSQWLGDMDLTLLETDQDLCPGWLPPVPPDLVSPQESSSSGPPTPRIVRFPATQILPITLLLCLLFIYCCQTNSLSKKGSLTSDIQHLVGYHLFWRPDLYGFGYPRQPTPHATLDELTFHLFLGQVHWTIYTRITLNSCWGGETIGAGVVSPQQVG